MRIAAVIAEYNPFHKGHAYLLEQVREQGGADAVICIMSGSFTQRGELALLDKWRRASLALEGGADLVVELPFLYAVSPAEYFAFGGVSLAQRMGCVNMLAFGSECGHLEILEEAAQALLSVQPETLRAHMKEGCSYPEAAAQIAGKAADSPNNLLGITYLMAIQRCGAKLQPFTVKRAGAGYHDERPQTYMSAAGIRKALSEGTLQQEHVPQNTYQMLMEAQKQGSLSDIRQLDRVLLGILRREGVRPDAAYLSEGLENRIMRAARNCKGARDLIYLVKTKRYPYTRITRMLVHLLMGTTAGQVQEALYRGPGYIRVLGFNETGQTLLRTMKRTAQVPVVIKSTAQQELTTYAQEQLLMDVRAQDFLALAREAEEYTVAGEDYTTSPVVL